MSADNYTIDKMSKVFAKSHQDHQGS